MASGCYFTYVWGPGMGFRRGLGLLFYIHVGSRYGFQKGFGAVILHTFEVQVWVSGGVWGCYFTYVWGPGMGFRRGLGLLFYIRLGSRYGFQKGFGAVILHTFGVQVWVSERDEGEPRHDLLLGPERGSTSAAMPYDFSVCYVGKELIQSMGTA